MKKTTHDDPKPARVERDDHQHDDATRRILDVLLQAPPVSLDSLKPTLAHKTGPRSPFGVLPDVRAVEALSHVSLMLKSAEEVSDEITALASGIERGLVWSLVHFGRNVPLAGRCAAQGKWRRSGAYPPIRMNIAPTKKPASLRAFLYAPVLVDLGVQLTFEVTLVHGFQGDRF